MGRRRRVGITGVDNVVGSSSGSIDFQDLLPKRKKNHQKDEAEPKRKKNHQKDEAEQNSDRLSELHDSLLVEILSYLPMKDAVRTGVLCKRWKTLWTLVDRIRFCCDPYIFGVKRFSFFVEQTLMQCSCPNLKEFSLSNFRLSRPIIERWLQYVARKNVKFLNLELSNGRIPVLAQFSWLSLEKLSLKYTYIHDEHADILLGCPLLDTLVLDHVFGFKHLNITSSKLRKLKMISFSHSYVPLLEINTPSLQELEMSGYCGCFQYRLVDVSSLVFAKVTFAYNDNVDGNGIALDTVTEILKKLHHVEELIVGPLLIEALSVLKVLGMPSPLFKCKKLTIESALRNRDLHGIACLLQRSPNLETLFIQLVRPVQPMDFKENYDVNGVEYLSMQEGNFQHLKNVRIVDGRNLCVNNKSERRALKSFEFDFVACLLKNACVLEKFVFTSPINNNCECSINCALKLSPKLINSCLDGNEAAKCEFKKNQSEYEFVYLARGLDK